MSTWTRRRSSPSASNRPRKRPYGKWSTSSAQPVRCTEPIGWNVRELFQDNHLAPYDVWRQLRFLEFKIRLRDLIMNRLNTTLAEVGSQLDFQAAIELSGLPTLQDVDNAK